MDIEQLLADAKVDYTRTADGRIIIRPQRVKPNTRVSHKSSHPESDIVAYIRDNPGTNVRRVARVIGFTRYSTEKMLESLIAQKRIYKRTYTCDVKRYTKYYAK